MKMCWEGGGGGGGGPGGLLLAVLVLVALAAEVHAEVLTPPYFNLAERRRVTATATCGEGTQGPELYCKLVGANADKDANMEIIQGQVCDFCDPSEPEKRHPAEYAVDGAETWWQSPPLSRGMKYNEVTLTIDLGQTFHVAYVFIKMANSPRPAIWVLERSTDNGKTYKPWQYFADSPSECEQWFGPETLLPITRDDQVYCEIEYSKIVPLEGGEIVVSFLNKRPSANDFFNSTILQEFTRATNIRLRFLRTKNLLGHLMSVARQDPTVTRRYFYSIKDISIGGRCVCNGHAENCANPDPNDQYKLLCSCKHNTCGTNCEMCCPGFEQKRWRQSKRYELFQCEPCNCHGHSDKCIYDEEVDEKKLSIDIHGNYEGGGVCQSCRHNTEGVNCNRCKAKYYRPYGKPLNATDVCQPCQCDDPRFTGNCAEGSGQCECKQNFTAPYCDSCNFGYYGYPECKQCECFINGTRGNMCEAVGGQCQCKQAYGGRFCRECAQEYFGYPNCTACDCNRIGSQSSVCQTETGKCPCRSNFGGRQCDQCADGYHTYPDCIFCKCDTSGTLPEVCDKGNGKCLCKEGYDGERCDRCKPGYHGYPNCRPCNCSEVGSSSSICDASGKCPCLANFAGRSCDQCRSGFYRFPECLACFCDSHGSVGVSCDANGHCQCKENFEGARCDQCKEGLYNFPICEECNCNPYGTISTFGGCGTLPAGELCKCKSRVEGRVCNECKPTYWNLQPYHRDGCEECDCHIPGVMGGINVCNTQSGQCLCKPSVGSRRCEACKDGSYNLSDDNLFGCTDCGCDIGGSVDGICNKSTGQCICHPRIQGRTCNEPILHHYFPTLHHLQYEAEDGLTPQGERVRYRWDENEFANYSWKGYAFFTVPQNEINYNVKIEKPSLYRMVLRYINPGTEAEVAHIAIIPESQIEPQQSFQVLLMPTNGTPAFTTVADKTNKIPSPLVMDPGNWIINIKYSGARPLLLDYFSLLPASYYEAGILVKTVSEPCTIGNQTVCQQYHYPKMGGCDIVRGETALIDDQGNRQPIREIYENDQHVQAVGLNSKPAMLSPTQPELHFDLTISEPGKHILVISYVTPPDANTSTNVVLMVDDEQAPQLGRAVLHPCSFTAACRQAVIDDRRVVSPFRLDKNYVKLTLKAEGPANAAIDCVVAVPLEDWSLDYIQPKPLCVRKDGQCVGANFPTPPDSKRIEPESDNDVSTVKPPMISDNTSTLIYLDYNNPTVDAEGKVPGPGQYVFVVHYYQPDHPGFALDTVIQNENIVQNGQYHEGKLPIRHCPSNSGCRSVIQQSNGSNRTLLSDSFIVTLKQQPTRFGVWIDYILVIPAEQFTPSILEQDDLDQTGVFLNQCGQNHFYIDPKTKGFCREAVFSLTSAYNSGALKCNCDYLGSTDFECAKFGGQCPCKANVIGRRCTECRNGYYGFPDCKPCDCPATAICEEKTGKCECAPKIRGEKCDQCEENTFALDPYFGCEDCNCSPQGVVDNNLQCDLNNGSCSCKPNIVGRHCDKCLEGYWLFPQCQICDCDLRGCREEICDQVTAQCYCKSNVNGEACDVCVDGTFDIQASNVLGCTKCFCFGKTTRCDSATLFRAEIQSMENWVLSTITYQPTVIVTPMSFRPEHGDGGVVADLTDAEAVDKVVFFKAPQIFYGNMLTAYGGNLNYTLFYTTGPFGGAIGAPDIILHGSATNQYLLHFSLEQPASSLKYNGSVQIIESNFVLSNGLPVSRETLMQTLQTLDEIYIRATYMQQSVTSRLLNVSLDTAQEQHNTNGIAHAVEECICPPGYKGLSCEDCASGYYRSQTGPYGGYCVPCQCNGHSDVCDPVTGICMECQHFTTGDHCEECESGYHGDASVGTPHDCLICACPLPYPSNNFASSCYVSPDGDSISCDCKEGYFGAQCQSCAAGYYGKPRVQGDYCKPCVCNNNIDPSNANSCDSVSGECMTCLNNTFGESCQYCAPGFYGDAIIRKDCQSCICDACGTAQCNNYTGICECKPNVAGEKCDTCAPDHYGFNNCKGCSPCDCGLASDSTQCDDVTGQCRCKPGVTGRTCDKCKPGYWNYGPEGCVSCGCNQEYSVGFGCNAATGQCECLPGVIGEKCDHCPYRWVLKDDEGCFECDACTHGLLNVTDELAATIDPQRADFESAAASHFTQKRLEYINDTALDMAPTVKNLTRVDFVPIAKAVQDLTRDTEQHSRNGAYKLETAEQTAPTGAAVHQALLNLEKSMVVASDNAEATVQEINNITFSLEAGSGPQTEYSIRLGEKLLKEMEEQDFSDPEKEADRVLEKAEQIKENMAKFAEPVTNHSHLLLELQKQLNEFNDKLENLRNNSDSTVKLTTETKIINEKNKNAQVKNKVNAVNQLAESAQNILNDAKELLTKTAKLIIDAKKDFSDIELAATRVVEIKNSLNDSINEQKVKLSELEDVYEGADVHAAVLANRAAELEKQLSPTRDQSQFALTAANAYLDIVNALQEALKTAEEASEAAQNASDMLTGLGDKTSVSQKRSMELLQNAHSRLEEAQVTLSPKLKMAISNVMFVQDLTSSGQKGIDDIEKILTKMPTLSLIDPVNKAGEESARAQESVQDAVSGISDILTTLPDQSKMAKQVPKDVDDSREAISQADNQLRSLRMVKTFNDAIDDVKSRQEAFNASAVGARSSIEELKQKVAEARENVNRIRVGVRFHRDTTLQLRNPESLSQQTTSSRISVYFRTSQPNGLILYLGNEKDSSRKVRSLKSRRTKTDDYIALVVENSYPVLTVDLGSGPTRIIVTKIVDDGVWYQAIIERIGKSARLTIREEGINKEDVLYYKEDIISGTNSILNLDPENSKLFVGGFLNFRIQDDIIASSFDGEMEELVIGDTPVSLWSFVSGSLNRNLTGAYERNKLVSSLTSNAGYRFNGSGYVVLDGKPYLQKERSAVQFRFKTKMRNGLLFLIGNEKQFFSVELRDGRILYQFDLGDGPVRMLSPEGVKYNDDEWHLVEAARDRKVGLLKIHGEESARANSGGFIDELTPTNEVYFGGYPDSHSYRDVTNLDFDGCIDNVQIDSGTIDLSKNVKATGVSPGCPPKFVGQISFSEKAPGYLRWSKVDAADEIQLNLRFKTSSTPGLIAYITDEDQTSTLSLSMVEGILVLRSKNAEVTTHPTKYNDGEWHVVTATYDRNGLQLDVDDFEMFKTPNTGSPLQIQDGNLFFGGIPKDYILSPGASASANSFVGCLADATVGRTLINFANVTDRRNVSLNKCPIGSDPVDYPAPSPEEDVITREGDDQDGDDDNIPVTTSTAPTPITPPTPAPTPAGQCVLPFSPANDPDVREDSGVRFGSKPYSRYEFSALPKPLKQKYELSFDFKTEKPNGTIFFVTDKNIVDHIALYLVNGKVHYSFNCGSGAALLVSKDAYNDNEWHTVLFARHGVNGTLSIDEVIVATGSSVGLTKTLNVEPPFLLGSLSESLPALLKDHNSLSVLNVIPGFVGCLRYFKMNKKPVVQNRTVTEGVLPCSDKVEKGFFIGPEGGYIKAFDKFRVGFDIDLSIEVKPRYTSGILVSVHSNKDYLILQLVNGTVKFTVDNGEGPITVEYKPVQPQDVCNGDWLRIQAVKSKAILTLGVNDFFVEPFVGKQGSAATDTRHPLFIGGHPNPKGLPGIETTEQFVGCVRNVAILRDNKNMIVSLTAAKTSGSVISNVCPTI
ncbi:laminin subunit alpha [Frankliniella occidentalis]|uniref:Laminin subunit alpha n=1 Tax=Frankliniella occidentalis TaxID=133901 RepID=A0A6J1THD4_FRAOC|nr:laminin subunit alpha [Frankliniella occidentalis]